MMSSLVLFLAGCLAAAQVEKGDPAQAPRSWVEQSLAYAVADRIEKDRHAGEFGTPVSDGVDFGALLTGRYFVAPRVVTPLPELFPAPDHDPYDVLNVLTEEIRHRPNDPAGYELRADVLDRLGWPVLAQRDRERAEILRAAGLR